MQAIFMSGYRPAQWVPQVQRRLLEASEAQEKEVNEANAKVDAAVARLEEAGRRADSSEYADKLFADRLAELPEAIREDVRAALAADAREAQRGAEVPRGQVPEGAAARRRPRWRSCCRKRIPITPRRAPRWPTSIKAEEAKRRDACRRSAPCTTCRARRRRSCCAAATTSTPGRRCSPACCPCWTTAQAVRLDAAGQGRADQRPAAGLRGVADAAGPSADGPRAGQPPLAAPLRRGHRRHARQLRPHRVAAEPSRIARLAGHRVRRPRLVRSRRCTG